ncbi:MAG: N-acetyl-gamma-glutamyl-phosphate reductase [Desulfobacter sp.]|nr:MAG: N-acetyl-gamma-glutamyl-phosphate reductase [Desulfobacter sp.]
MYTVFIDGQEGTTGLEIKERLEGRKEIELLEIPGDKRKDPEVKREFINGADLVILCLPDAVAKESVALAEGGSTRFIDASTAHRTHPDWVYGLPEMSPVPEQAEKIRRARFVANPGCYPTGFILMARPLVDLGILPRDYPVSVHAVSGYSGGGKKLIARHRAGGDAGELAARPYGFTLAHKHVPEMQAYAGLDNAPIFTPSVGDFYRGMLVHLPLHTRLLKRKTDADGLRAELRQVYGGQPFVRVMPDPTENYLDQGFLSPLGCNNTNRVDIFVSGHEDQILVTARLDNLGKGASGAAVQNLNIMLGMDQGKGLTA